MRPDDPLFLSGQDRRLAGVVRRVLVPAPAAGVDLSASPPGGRMWRVYGGTAALTASGAVATRIPRAIVTLAGVQVWEAASDAAVTAGSTAQMLLMRMPQLAPADAQTAHFQACIPDFWLRPGDSIGFSTASLQAGDQWSAASLAVEECYFDDTQLSEAHLEREQEERAIAEHSQAILIGG